MGGWGLVFGGWGLGLGGWGVGFFPLSRVTIIPKTKVFAPDILMSVPLFQGSTILQVWKGSLERLGGCSKPVGFQV